MTEFFWRLAGMMGCAVLICSAQAGAAMAANPSYSVQTYVTGQNGHILADQRTNGVGLFSTLALGQGEAVAQAVPLSGGTALARAHGTLYRYDGLAEIIYTIRLVGPTLGLGQTIPVGVFATGYANSQGGLGGMAQASASIYIGAQASLYRYANSSLNQGLVSFSASDLLGFVPNTDYQVVLRAQATGGNPYSNDYGFAEAYVDPLFTLDKAYAAYRLVGVVGQAGPVPEPAAWVLISLGCALVGAALRRRMAGQPPSARMS